MLEKKENEIKEKENENIVDVSNDFSAADDYSAEDKSNEGLDVASDDVDVETEVEKEDSNIEDDVSEEGDTFTPSPEEKEESDLGEQHESTSEPAEDQGEVGEEMSQPEKMLTQSQVNVLIGKARQEGRESAMKELFGRYGVSSDEELNDVFGRGQAYDDLNDEYSNNVNQYKSMLAENALLKIGVPENRWEDVKLILGGKGFEVNADNISAEMATHPEWRSGSTVSSALNENKILTPEKAEELAKTPSVDKLQNDSRLASNEPTKLIKLGNESSQQPITESEEEKMNRIFGFSNKN